MTLLRLQGAADLFQGLHEGDQAEAHAYLQREGSHHGGYPGRGSDQGEAGHERNLWPVIPEPEQLTIAEYMDVVSVCRTDSAMTGREERKEWQKALKGLHSVAMNK